MKFDVIRLITILFLIVVCWFICQKRCDYKLKTFFTLFFGFLTIYCGIGGALVDVSIGYYIYFILYVVIFTTTIRFWNKRNSFNNYSNQRALKNSFIVQVIDKYGNYVTAVFFLINILILIYPENRLYTLIHPPMPDISQRLSFYENKQNYSSIFDNAKILITPFFYMFLYKYRNKMLFAIILLILNLYMTYCADSYASRGVILQTIMVIFFLYFFSVDKKRRRKVVLVVALASPILIVSFVIYSYARIGEMGVNVTFGEALELLFSQEINYPLHYNDYINISGGLIDKYFVWFVLQPFPSFMKFGLGGDVFNEVFTNIVIGKYNWERDFSISLPGLVGESIFIFKNFFFIHAFMLATILSVVFNYLRKRPYLFFLTTYYIVQFAQELPRGGTQSVYSTLAKSFLILVIIIFFIERNNRTYSIGSNTNNSENQ